MWNRGKAKYSNKASVCQLGHSHRSGLETSVCAMLQRREREHEIVLEQVEDHVYLTDARILYIPDFRCRNVKTCLSFYVEAKGFETPEWRIKRRLYQHYGRHPLEIWMGTAARPFLKEIIIPKNIGDQ